MSDKKVVTRFAPSPTGFLHIGGLRTAAYAYALAKHEGGDFILRIEDTDQKREVAGAAEKIEEILKVFNLNWDEYHVQSKRVETGIYKKAAEKLIDDGHAFYCFCKPKTKEEIKADQAQQIIHLRDVCRKLTKDEIQSKILNGEKPAVRLKVPDNEILEFYDFVIRKKTSWKSSDVPDAMLLKSDGFPTYHLAMPVDDNDMHVTHVIRAMEWFSSTPIHVLMFKYLGFELPQIGHPSVILDQAGGKLSKRKGNVSVEEFLNQGYLPQALFNFVILLGWAPKDNREMFSLSEFVKHFDVNGFQKSNPVFNVQKLDWFNSQYISKMSDKELAQILKNESPEGTENALLEKISTLVKTRMKKTTEFKELAAFFFDDVTVDKDLFSEKYTEHLRIAEKALERVKEFTPSAIGDILMESVRENEFQAKDFFMDLRIAITGKKITPPLNESMEILGKEKVLQRLKSALQ